MKLRVLYFILNKLSQNIKHDLLIISELLIIKVDLLLGHVDMRATKERILEAKLQIKKIRKAGEGRKKRKRKLEVILPQVIVAVVAEGN